MKPRMYPSFMYRRDHPDGYLFRTEDDWAEYGGESDGWVDSPAKIEQQTISEPEIVDVKKEVKPKNRRGK